MRIKPGGVRLGMHAMLPDLMYNLAYPALGDLEVSNSQSTIVRSFLEGRYERVIECVRGDFVPVKRLDDRDSIDLRALEAAVGYHLLSKGYGGEDELNTFLFGLSCLMLFVQGIQVGPAPPISCDILVPDTLSQDKKEIEDQAYNELDVDGGGLNALTPNLLYLFYARKILTRKMLNGLDQFAVGLAELRASFIHQKVIGTPNKNLMETSYDILERLEACLSTDTILKKAETLAAFYVEASLVYLYYRSFDDSDRLIGKASEAINFSWEFSGVMGRRTKFQTFDVPQLVINVKTKSEVTGEDLKECEAPVLPVSVRLDDDVVLDSPKLSSNEGATYRRLSSIEQCILLVHCLQIEKKELGNVFKKEEILSIIQRVISDARCWCVALKALYFRSRLEISEARRSERAALQLRSLLNDIEGDHNTSLERLKYVFCVDTPLILELKNDIGEYMLVIGAIKDSINTFTALNMWEKVALCYQIMGEYDNAEKIIRKCIAETPTPRLYCVLGDIKKDPSQYEKAWDLSKRRYSRAAGSLGLAMYKENRYEDAIEYLKKAIELNPIDKQSWFTLACSAVKLEKWDAAINAFKRVINISPDDSSSWCNLSTCYVQVSKRREALAALKETLKYKWDDNILWENYTILSMSMGEFNNSIAGMRRIIEICSSSSKKVSPLSSFFKIFRRLIDLTDESKTAIEKSDMETLNTNVSSLVTYMVDEISYVFEALLVALEYYKLHKLYKQALDLYFRIYRLCMRDLEVDRSVETFKKYAEHMISLVEFYNLLIDEPNTVPNSISQDMSHNELLCCKEDLKRKIYSVLHSFTEKTRENFGETDYHRNLTDELEKLKRS